MTARMPRPRAVRIADWERLIMDLEEYREREAGGVYDEINEMAQSITELCVEIFLTKDDQ